MATADDPREEDKPAAKDPSGRISDELADKELRARRLARNSETAITEVETVGEAAATFVVVAETVGETASVAVAEDVVIVILI